MPDSRQFDHAKIRAVEQLIMNHHEQTGHVLRLQEIQKMGVPTGSFLRLYGTFGNGLKKLGLDIQLTGQRWTREEMIQAVQDAVATTGMVPSGRSWTKATESNPSKVTVGKEFGGWRRFLVAAGIDLEKAQPSYGVYWNQDRIIEALIRWASDNGHWPRKKDWQRSGHYWPGDWSVRNTFGRWNSAIEAAQRASSVKYKRIPARGSIKPDTRLKPRKYIEDWPESSLLEAAVIWYEQYGRWPLSSDWASPEDHRYPNYKIVRVHFDSWRSFVEAAGAPVFVRKDRRTSRPVPYHLRVQVIQEDTVCPNPHCDQLNDQLVCDHYEPKVRGGSDDLENLKPLCFACNSRRQDTEWFLFLEREHSRSLRLGKPERN